MHIIHDTSFIKASRALPKGIQVKLAKSIERLKGNPFHPLLHTKQLSGALAGLLSFRITREWRVIFYFQNPEVIQLIKVAHRKDIYR